MYPNLRLELGIVNQVLDDYYTMIQRFKTTGK